MYYHRQANKAANEIHRLTEEKGTAEFACQEATVQLAEAQEELASSQNLIATLKKEAQSSNTYLQEIEGCLESSSFCFVYRFYSNLHLRKAYSNQPHLLLGHVKELHNLDFRTKIAGLLFKPALQTAGASI